MTIGGGHPERASLPPINRPGAANCTGWEFDEPARGCGVSRLSAPAALPSPPPDAPGSAPPPPGTSPSPGRTSCWTIRRAACVVTGRATPDSISASTAPRSRLVALLGVLVEVPRELALERAREPSRRPCRASSAAFSTSSGSSDFGQVGLGTEHGSPRAAEQPRPVRRRRGRRLRQRVPAVLAGARRTLAGMSTAARPAASSRPTSPASSRPGG